ncbi:TatD family hydrolase [Pseudogracilibacillus sp. SE30717A]|uniref:TatD family hydrolase n=1 Tax=Pseudogracilibacillus sp. SE30717A TaxID=3098293 RepID=UPI00300E3118
MIDAHIHIDDYKKESRLKVLQELKQYNVTALIAVAKNITSSKLIYELSKDWLEIKPAFGYHPEQRLPTEQEMEELIKFIEDHNDEMIAIGEVGLPFYQRTEDSSLPFEAYIELLEYFIRLAKKYNKPIVLHAVYEDAEIALDLLEKHSIDKAHFHWFKADNSTVERLIANRYHISVTPDILYSQRSIDLMATYPLTLTMVETDGPWPFTGPFTGELTHPKMVHQVIRKIASIKKLAVEEIYKVVYRNTKSFYRL